VPPAHLHYQLSLPFRDPYGAFGETYSDGPGSEVGAAIPPLGFKISKSSNRFGVDMHTDILRRTARVGEHGSNATSVEDAIKIFTSRLGQLVRFVDLKRRHPERASAFRSLVCFWSTWADRGHPCRLPWTNGRHPLA
jgi:hypothetical protein